MESLQFLLSCCLLLSEDVECVTDTWLTWSTPIGGSESTEETCGQTLSSKMIHFLFETDYFLSFSFQSSLLFLSLLCPRPPPVSASQLFLPSTQKINSQSFYRSKTEESNSSRMSCQITTSGDHQVDLQSLVKGFQDIFSTDFGQPVLHSGVQVNMRTKQISSKSTCVREGRKINMTLGIGRFGCSDESDWTSLLFSWSKLTHDWCCCFYMNSS